MPLKLQLLGGMALTQDGTPLALPRSRKVRALIAYLALAPRPVTRHHLSELLWDTPNDPRGELRWCLSKARSVLDTPGHACIVSEDDTIRLDLTGLAVDVLTLDAAMRSNVAALDVDALRDLLGLFKGDFLEGMALQSGEPCNAWLAGQRRRLRTLHAVVLEHLCGALPIASDEAAGLLSRWVEVAPFDRRAHERLLAALAARGQLRDGEEHLQAAVKLFESEGQDAASVVHAWRVAKAGNATGGTALVVTTATHPLVVEQVLAPERSAQRISIAVMPFEEDGVPMAPVQATFGAGLASDMTTRLAKLRSLFVISHISATALVARGMDAQESARVLDVDYVASGSLRREGQRVRVQVQLTAARTARIVWADVLDAPVRDTLAMFDEIGDHLVSGIAHQIELAERNRAILKAPSLLDAWEAHHCGLWHMYRFNEDNNEQARRFFQTAIQLDPTFARPYAGLSFTHFQSAFLGWGDHAQHTEMAYRIAAQGALTDDQDPSTRWALGRANWLRGDIRAALSELEVAVDLSPNFSLGHYTLSFVQAQSGDAQTAIEATDHARKLSPYDPLLFAMLATRALALMRLGRYDEAANWALKAIARPNAHVHILGIAAHCLALAERHDEARRVAADIQHRSPGYSEKEFLSAFRFGDDALTLIRRVNAPLGLR
jgi:DNA-binding SARP family transcriptional activator/TolB-like protein